MGKSKDLAKCGDNELREFLDSFDVVLSDCDGVLWRVGAGIEDAVKVLQRFENLGKKVYTVTNNSTRSSAEYCKQLRADGFEATPDQIVTTAKVIAWYLKKINFQGEAFAIASREFQEVLRDAGIDLIPPPKIKEGDIHGTVKVLSDRSSVRAIITDCDLHCDWAKLAFAVSCLQRDDVLFLAGALDEWVACGKSNRIMGPGAMTNVLIKQTGKEPISFAKPSEIAKDYIYANCDVSNPRRCLFIGDTVKQDMKFGGMCKFLKFFVSTGCDTLQEAEQNEETQPDYYIHSLGHLLPILDRLQNQTCKKS